MAMGTEFTVENVEKAVNNFYCNASVQQEAHQWLTAAQVSSAAWSFCWQLLSPDKSLQVQYFGASTLHVKISRYWNEVPADQYESLRSRILEQIVNSATGPKLILTRLCVALSSLALHSMPQVWPNPIDSLIIMFQDDSSPLNSTQRFTHKCQKSKLRHELTQNMTKILALLTNLMSPNSPSDVYEHALKCFGSWVDFGIQMNEAEQIIIQVFQSLNSPHLFDSAVDTLVKVFSHPDSHRFPYTIQKLLPLVLQLQGMLNSAINDHDMDTCQGIAQIVVSLAESHSNINLTVSLYSFRIHARDTCQGIAQIVVSLAESHSNIDLTLSLYVFRIHARDNLQYFEDNLLISQDNLHLFQDNLQDLEPEKYQLLLPMFQPVYLGLIENLLIKVQYPSDEVYETWSAEEKEHFRCYRQDIGDTMMYAYSILREPLLGYLCNALASLVKTDKELSIRWELMEAVFFLFNSVAESVDLEEGIYLPSVLELLPKLPFTNVKFISTVLYMLGSFGEWMNYHPQSLSCAIPLLLQGLGNPEVAMAATMALKDVTRETLEHIQPFVPQILQACQAALERGNLKSRENIRVMSCIGQVLSVLPYSDIMGHLDPILTPIIQELEQLSKQQPSSSVKNRLLLKINMLSWLFASLDTDRELGGDKQAQFKSQGPKPVFVILQRIAPILQTIVSDWIYDAGVVEAICELFKRSLQTLMDDFAPLSKDVAELLVQMYQTVPHIAILDLTKQLILMFHSDAEFSNVVKVLLQSVCNKTLELFQGDIHQHTDIVENFMLLLAQVLKKTKHMLFESGNNINGLFQAGVVGLSLPENHTVKASCSFLTELISQKDVAAVQEVVMSQGEVLLDRIMRAVGGESPRMIMESIADVLFCLSKHFLEQMRIWSQDFVTKEGYPSVRCTSEDKDKFIKAVLRERSSKMKVRAVVKEFTLLCRGLLGTEYASQMAELM
ncbi:importin-13-like [Mercenaria mercenaria]|uniref:importin-13-like n=1 Tax=Mercenaria mercenaria TaxID=6596 RepID=UPI00234EDAF4|nr:importin-13-like [Mercenaria mercenaria]